MPRPPKKSAEEKAKALPVAVVPPPTMVPAPVVGGLHPAVVPAPVVSGVPQRVVDNDSFIRVRDSVSFHLHLAALHFCPPLQLQEMR